MRSDVLASGRFSSIAAWSGLAFLHVPVLITILYAFTTEDRTYQFRHRG